MSAQPTEVEQPDTVDNGDSGALHLVCHCDNYNVAFCGFVCSEGSEVVFNDDDPDCVVCADMSRSTGGCCPRCGYLY
jgi:hypothetical protein